jgi:hypothetical protein
MIEFETTRISDDLNDEQRALLQQARWGYTVRVLLLLVILPAPLWFGGERWLGVATGSVDLTSLALWVWTIITLIALRLLVGWLRQIERLNADLYVGRIESIKGRMLYAEVSAPHLTFPVAVEIERVVLRVPRRVKLPPLPTTARATYTPRSRILLAWEHI